VRTGTFDRLLLRPRSVLLQLIGHDFRLGRFGRLAQGLLVLLIGAQFAAIEWSLSDVLMTLWAVAGGIALFFGLIVLQGGLSFWTIESLEVANVLTYGGVQAAQYPLSLYNDWLRGLLTFVVPLACVAYYPVLTLLDRPDPLGAPAWLGYVAPLAGFMFAALSLVAWRLGVRHYTSAGS
jgi:ABC-2 type transport system permease protein